jgi:hypothetical protein
VLPADYPAVGGPLLDRSAEEPDSKPLTPTNTDAPVPKAEARPVATKGDR